MEASSIEEIIICQYEKCKEIYVKPVTLICCGESICQEHLDDLIIQTSTKRNHKKIKIKCCFCCKEFQLPEEGLPSSKKIYKLIGMNLGPTHSVAKSNLESLDDSIRKYKNLKNYPDFYIHTYFDRIRNSIDLSREEDKLLIDNYYDNILKQLNSLEDDCKLNIYHYQVTGNQDLDRYESHYEKWKAETKKFIVDEEKWYNINTEIKKTLTEIENKANEFQSSLLNKKTYNFVKAAKNINPTEVLGSLIVNEFKSDRKFDLVSCSYDKSIKIWNLENGQCKKTLIGHLGEVICIKLLSNNRLISSSWDKTIKLWDISSNECLKTFDSKNLIAFNLTKVNEYEFISGYGNGEINLWNINGDKPLKLFHGHKNIILGIEYIRERNQFISCCIYENIKVWNIHTGECVRTIQSNNDRIFDIKLKDSNELIVCTRKGKIRKLDLNTGQFMELIQALNTEIWCIELLSESRLATSSKDKTIKIWDLTTFNCLSTLNGHTDIVVGLKFLYPSRLISCSSDKTIRMWDLNTYECIQIFAGEHSDYITYMELIETFLKYPNHKLSN